MVKETQDIINAATIQGTFSNRFQITGLDSAREARNLALLLRAGALPTPINIVEERTVGPDLGEDSIRSGTFSLIVGYILKIEDLTMDINSGLDYVNIFFNNDIEPEVIILYISGCPFSISSNKTTE